MVLFLNYLPWMILSLGAYLTYKATKLKPAIKRNSRVALTVVGTFAAMIILQGLTAGYIPKKRSSEVKIPAPTFEHTETEIQNRLRRPERLGDESEERFKEKTDWQQHKRDEAAKAGKAEVSE